MGTLTQWENPHNSRSVLYKYIHANIYTLISHIYFICMCVIYMYRYVQCICVQRVYISPRKSNNIQRKAF